MLKVLQRRDTHTVIALTAPAYLWLALAVFLPLSAMLYFSVLTVPPFGDRQPELTLTHYQAFIDRGFYRTLTWRSLQLGLEVTLWCLAIGFPSALALAKYVPGRWREALFLMVVLPFWSNALVRTFSWTMVLGEGGLVNAGIQSVWPGAPTFDLLFTREAIVIGLVHAFVPYMILTCYLSLQAIDDALIEAARTLGAGAFTILRRIVVPLAAPGIFAGVVLIFVPVIGAFMEPRILGGRAGTFLGTVIEDQFTVAFNWPRGAALSFIMLGIVLVILLLASPVLKRHLRGV
ncbi:MAG: ABC transporter permease [Gammaproteobacteria bacterium]